ncbi:hypothetical protein HY374_01200 [Candidatus Berkelbacteria bacterium]|nr:hypothetical protein [Candidatus Berkelbacteria bacterium]
MLFGRERLPQPLERAQRETGELPHPHYWERRLAAARRALLERDDVDGYLTTLREWVGHSLQRIRETQRGNTRAEIAAIRYNFGQELYTLSQRIGQGPPYGHLQDRFNDRADELALLQRTLSTLMDQAQALEGQLERSAAALLGLQEPESSATIRQDSSPPDQIGQDLDPLPTLEGTATERYEGYHSPNLPREGSGFL